MWEQALSRFTLLQIPSRALYPDMPLHFRLPAQNDREPAIRFDALDASLFEPKPFDPRVLIAVLHMRDGRLLSRGQISATPADIGSCRFVWLKNLDFGKANLLRNYYPDLEWPVQLRAEWFHHDDDVYVDVQPARFRDSLVRHIHEQGAPQDGGIYRLKNRYEALPDLVVEHAPAA